MQKGSLSIFFLPPYLKKSETHQHFDPSRSNLRTSMKTTGLGQGTPWVWSSWTFHRRSWTDKTTPFTNLCLCSVFVWPHTTTRVCSVCSLQAPAQVLPQSWHTAAAPGRHQCALAFHWDESQTLCVLFTQIACHWRSPERWIHQLLDLINTGEKEGMVFWVLLFWPRRKNM